MRVCYVILCSVTATVSHSLRFFHIFMLQSYNILCILSLLCSSFLFPNKLTNTHTVAVFFCMGAVTVAMMMVMVASVTEDGRGKEGVGQIFYVDDARVYAMYGVQYHINFLYVCARL